MREQDLPNRSRTQLATMAAVLLALTLISLGLLLFELGGTRVPASSDAAAAMQVQTLAGAFQQLST